jgi:hypothetical protein
MRLVAAVSAPLLGVLGTVAALAGGRDAAAVDPVKLRQALALTQGRRVAPTVSLTPARARELTRSRGVRIPLPDGGNFNGIRWEAARAPIPGEHWTAILQHNAACQWLRASGEGRERPTAEAILALAGRWPALRDGAFTALPATTLDCYRSHRREVAYAVARGWTPST